MGTTASDLSIDGVAAADAIAPESRAVAISTTADAADQPVTRHLKSPFHLRKISRPRPAEERVERPSEDKRRVARNLAALAGGQAVTWTCTLIWTLIIPRAIGPVGVGILVSAQAVSGVLGIALGIGARDYLVRETVATPAVGPRLIGTVIALRIALAPVVGLAAVAWARLAHYGHDATIVLYLITAMTIFIWLLDAVQAAFQAIERMTYIAYANVVNKAAQSIAGIALVVVGFGAVGIAADMAIIVGLVVLLSWSWLRPYFRIDLRTNVTLIARVAKESRMYWAASVFWMIYFWIDMIMLTLMTRPTVVGWYGASTQIFQTLMFLPALVATAWLPRLVTAFNNSRRDLYETARTPIELVLMLSMPIAAAILIGADAVFRVVYGPAFAQAVPVMMVLALCIPPMYLGSLFASVLVAEKRQGTWTMVMAGAAVVNPLLNLALIPLTQHQYHNGAIGTAIGLVLTEMVVVGAGLVLVGRHVLDWRILRRCGLMCLASIGTLVVALITRHFGTATSFVAGFATFGGLVLLLRIVRQEEWAFARSGIAHVQVRLRRSRQ